MRGPGLPGTIGLGCRGFCSSGGEHSGYTASCRDDAASLLFYPDVVDLQVSWRGKRPEGLNFTGGGPGGRSARPRGPGKGRRRPPLTASRVVVGTWNTNSAPLRWHSIEEVMQHVDVVCVQEAKCKPEDQALLKRLCRRRRWYVEFTDCDYDDAGCPTGGLATISKVALVRETIQDDEHSPDPEPSRAMLCSVARAKDDPLLVGNVYMAVADAAHRQATLTLLERKIHSMN